LRTWCKGVTRSRHVVSQWWYVMGVWWPVVTNRWSMVWRRRPVAS